MAEKITEQQEDKDAVIAKLKAEAEKQNEIIAELVDKTKASIAVPTVKVKGKTYKVLVPKSTYKGAIVDTTSLDEEVLEPMIGHGLVAV